MAVTQYYLDKRVLKANKDSTLGIKNLLDLNAFILSVVEDSTSEFTSINVDALVEKTAAHGVDVDGALIKDGGITANSRIAGFYPSVATNNITAGTGGAILVTNYFTTINTDAGGDAFTLANGTQIGQLKLIRLVADGGGNGVVTPTSLSGGTTITFDDAADEVELIWNGTAWVVIKNLGATVA
jgi:hypothetical protein